MRTTVKDFASFLKEDHNAEMEVNNNLEDEAAELELDTTVLDELVDLVGDEESVEAAAQMAYEDLKKRFDAGDTDGIIKDDEGEVAPENLSLAAVVVKLVELGKLTNEDSDSFLKKHIN